MTTTAKGSIIIQYKHRAKNMKANYKIVLTGNAEKFLNSLVSEQKNSMYDLIGMLSLLGYELDYPYSKKVHTKKNKVYED